MLGSNKNSSNTGFALRDYKGRLWYYNPDNQELNPLFDVTVEASEENSATTSEVDPMKFGILKIISNMIDENTMNKIRNPYLPTPRDRSRASRDIRQTLQKLSYDPKFFKKIDTLVDRISQTALDYDTFKERFEKIEKNANVNDATRVQAYANARGKHTIFVKAKSDLKNFLNTKSRNIENANANLKNLLPEIPEPSTDLNSSDQRFTNRVQEWIINFLQKVGVVPVIKKNLKRKRTESPNGLLTTGMAARGVGMIGPQRNIGRFSREQAKRRKETIQARRNRQQTVQPIIQLGQ